MADITRNLDQIINSVNLVTRESTKTGKPYTLCQIVLDNGLDIQFFPERAETKIMELLLDGAKKPA
jgi:hypothetical protein